MSRDLSGAAPPSSPSPDEARTVRQEGPIQHDRHAPLIDIVAGALLAAAYVVSEWLFFVTKPSVLSLLPWGRRVLVLVATASLAALLAGLATLPLAALVRVSPWRPARRAWSLAARLVPAFIASCLVLLLVENFTTTLLGFGLPSHRRILSIPYVFGVVATMWWLQRHLRLLEERVRSRAVRRAGVVVFGLALVGLATARLPLSAASSDQHGLRERVPVDRAARPNILFIGGDGIDAKRTSLYGYTRQTTPFLDRLAGSSLVCEAAFSNCAHTTGSLVALLTGRLPTTTHVVYRPDLLRGADAFEHLPGILRRHGYRSIDVTIRYYADPYDLNMRDGFDQANGRTETPSKIVARLDSWIGYDSALFAARSLDRVGSRLASVLLGKPIANPFQEVSGGSYQQQRDRDRVQELLRFIDASRQPFFAHIHLLTTHGPMFDPRRRLFSLGVSQNRPFQRDWFDDAVLDFDAYVEEIVLHLEAAGILDRTILVIYSDHDEGYRTYRRIPLVIRFPKARFAGAFSGRAQLIDVAPTMLDFLRLPIPPWMEGQSLLQPGSDPCRWLVAARVSGVNAEKPTELMASASPPFFSLGSVDVMTCSSWYEVELATPSLFGPNPLAAGSDCRACSSPTPADITSFVVRHLEKRGYDTSSLAALASHPQAHRVVTRGEAAEILVRFVLGEGVEPPPPTGEVFPDVPRDEPGAAWIELSHSLGLFGGTPDGTFMPRSPLTRAELAVVLVRAIHGGSFTPQPASGKLYGDVLRSHWASGYIEQLARDEGAARPSREMFHPERMVTRRFLTDLLRRRRRRVAGPIRADSAHR